MTKENVVDENSPEANERKYNFLQGRFLSSPPEGEEIVISGMSGTFPDSTDIYHFEHNLMNKINMMSESKRYRYKHPEIPEACGTIPVADKYDAGFFGVHLEQGHAQDGLSRNLLEKTVEALMDAGLNPTDLEGTKAGVYNGTCFSEVEKNVFHDKAGPNRDLAMSGIYRSSYGARISYFLKIKGPNLVADTACSSSLFGMESAFRDLRLGIVDTAIVCTAHLNFHPFVHLQFARLGVLSPDGLCKVFDEDSNGYGRSETIAVIILQKKKVAKRNYGEVIYIKSNCDGYKDLGITYPSGEAQCELMKECYKDIGIHPSELSYVEAHGTGTPVGDPEEGDSIDEALAKSRTNDPLLVGSVKSNIGHTEPASGLASIIKCVRAFETGFIPPNLHLYKPRSNVKGFGEGRMEIVTEKRTFKDKRGLVAINNFGFGGGNVHLLLRGNRKEKTNKGLPTDDLPRIVCISGRTSDSLHTIFDELKSNPLDPELVVLYHNIFRKEVPNHLYRGYSILSKTGEIDRYYHNDSGIKPTLYFAFGELNNWPVLGKNLLSVPVFAETLEKIEKLSQQKSINLRDIFTGENDDKYTNQVIGSIVVQIGLIEIFKALEIQAQYSVAYSLGKLTAAYYDEVLNLQQTIACAFVINDVVNQLKAKVGKEKYENEENTILGEHFKSRINASQYGSLKNELATNLAKVLDKSQKHSNTKDKRGSSEYFVSILTNNVSEKLDEFKKNSIIVAFGDVKNIKVDNEFTKILSLNSSDETDCLITLLKTIGGMYVYGYYPQLDKLYPKISFPISKGTRMISPFIKWNHERNYFVPYYDLDATRIAQQGAIHINMEVTDKEWAFVRGHVVDGRNLFPATGYLFIVWRVFAVIEDVPIDLQTVVIENVKFMRATNIPKKGHVKFLVTINRFSGSFEVVEGNATIVTGQIHSRTPDASVEVTEIIKDSNNLTLKDIYKELRLRGYNYSGGFRSIQEYNLKTNSALIKWENNWVMFLDNMLQMKLLKTDTRLLYVPTYISQIYIPANLFRAWVNKSFIEKEREPLLPAYVDENTGEIRCGGIVIKGLIASSISRKKDAIPVLESYEFIPNIAKLELEASVRVNSQIFLENALARKVKCVELIDDFTQNNNSMLIPLLQTAFGDQPLIQPIVKILSKVKFDEKEMTIPVEDKELSTETECNIVIGSKLFERPAVCKSASGSLKENGFIISREELNFDPSKSNIEDFTICSVHTTPEETIVLLKKNSKTKELITINLSSLDDFSWIEFLKTLIKTKKTDNVVLYAQHQPISGILGLVNCLRREPESLFVRCVLILDEAEEFDPEKPFYKEQLDKNIAINIWKNNSWGSYRHLPLKPLNNVESEHCYVNTTVRGDLSSLRWIESNLRSDVEIPPEKKLVYTHYASLNFRDIMTASGRINADVITQDRLEQECVQGVEFSGYTSEGKRVMGMVPQAAMSTMILADEHLLFDVPDNISLKDAATIPVVYGTVIYGMLLRAELKQHDSVLIHAGTGGIGQAAIRVALHYKCNIFTTVGTPEKREYLIKTFPQLKPHQIGNSRDISFEKMVKKYTNGKGVNMVLNSLAEEKLIASVRCLAKAGHFVEIGKFDLASNNELSLLLLEKEATFHGVMLDQLFSSGPMLKKELTKILENNIGNYIVPLPSTCFSYTQIEDAFRYMATGKHMGKVIIEVREKDELPKEIPEKFLGNPRYFCYPEKSYIIVGGLGGFGLELADWLVLRGAKKLILTSRKGISTGYQNMRVRTWESYGITVHISKDDIFTEEGCRNMLEEATQLGDVHAIFNLAVVLADAVFENQTEEGFRTSFGPKATATAHLDKLSRQICPNLKEFVIFSSVTCGRGNAGQTNYGMANSVMERICEKRRAEGYHALAIQWGAIGDVGLVAEMQVEHIELEIGGTLQQKISNCLYVLDDFLRQTDVTIISSMVVAEKRGGLSSCTNVVDAVLNILGLNPSKVSPHATFPELGMDSMTGVEIKQMLERDFEIFLTPKDMKTMTLAKLKDMQEKKVLSSDEKEGIDMSMLFNDIGDEQVIKQTVVSLKSKLSDDAAGPHLLFFPGIEGFANKYSPLADQLEAHVTAFQYWEDPDCVDIEKVSQLLLPKVRELVKQHKTFNVAAYSYGSLLALEIVRILESEGHTANILIIDGGALLMKKLIETFKDESDNIFETMFIFHLLALKFPHENLSDHQERMLKCNTWDERLTVAEEVVKKVTTPEKIVHMKVIMNGFYARVKAIQSYSPIYESKLKSKIRLFKPSRATVKDIDEDNGLSVITESNVDVTVFEGNHITMLESEQLGQAVNSWITGNEK